MTTHIINPNDDYAIKLLKQLLAEYKRKLENGDREERPIYSIVVEDIKGILVDLAHHK